MCEQDLADADTRWGGLIPLLNQAVLGVFTLEAAIKITAQGWGEYFADAWNRFDLGIVLLSYGLLGLNTSGGGVRTLRLLRLLRIIKLLHSFPGLRSVSASLLLALKNVGFVMLMMLLVNFVFAVIGALLFGRNDKMHFSHVANAMATVWMIETLDSWEEVLYTNMYGCDQYGYYDLHGYATSARGCTDPQALGWAAAAFVLIIVIFGGMVLPTVLIGVISIAFDESTRAINEEAASQATIGRVLKVAHMVGVVEAEATPATPRARRPRRPRRRRARAPPAERFVSGEELAQLRRIFDQLNFDRNPDELVPALDANELLPFLSVVCDRYLTHQPEEKLQQMFGVIDFSGDGDVDFPEFLWFMLYLRTRRTRCAGARAAAVGALRRAARSARALSPRASAREHRRAAGAPRAERDLDPRRAA